MKNLSVKDFVQSRDSLLETITSALEKDKMIVAAWLTGSYGRNETDEYSDIDITVVIEDDQIEDFLLADRKNSAESISAHNFVKQFAEAVNVHVRKRHAPDSGKMISVLYGNGVMVDWLFIPKRNAERPSASELIFQRLKIDVAEEPALTGEKDWELLQRKQGFFWMMAAISSKAILRGDDLHVNIFHETLLHIVEEIDCLKSGKVYTYKPKKDIALLISRGEQKRTLLDLCAKVNAHADSSRQLETIQLLLTMSNEQ